MRRLIGALVLVVTLSVLATGANAATPTPTPTPNPGSNCHWVDTPWGKGMQCGKGSIAL